MRIMLFFDLPTTDSQELKDYRQFRKFLIKSGFIMLQESVYIKMLLNSTAGNNFIEKIKNNLPPKGLVQIIVITEKQFQKMHTLVGSFDTSMLNNDERIEIF